MKILDQTIPLDYVPKEGMHSNPEDNRCGTNRLAFKPSFHLYSYLLIAAYVPNRIRSRILRPSSVIQDLT